MSDNPTAREVLRRCVYQGASAEETLLDLDQAGYAVVPKILSPQMRVDAVECLIDSGLDGPDGVGWSEVESLWALLISKAEDGK